MYLKSLEIQGFKSFADRTRMAFEPGMIVIVGPNGCGKSNISDAIRWVLGEQRPTALRCAKLGDVLFNGTEFNEVTISRRVYRSGEGRYFINKTPCRLRDVHRLLMGTGIGTTSYSVMAQGQIDAILSSKPEDRRNVFEEAAGITKFKADRKEALRKMEQTEANLLRLSDVIREVKRQAGSLQRQAGKAQKYKELRDELRGLDFFVTRRRLATLAQRIVHGETLTATLAGQLAGEESAVGNAEREAARIHDELLQTEQQIGALAEAAAQADSRLLRAQEVIRVNEQRIGEYQAWAVRDNTEITQTRDQITQLAAQLAELTHLRELQAGACATAQCAVVQAQQAYDAKRRALETTRAELQQMREHSVTRERRIAQMQNQLAQLESGQRSLLLQHERLAAEKQQLDQHLHAATENSRTLTATHATLHTEAEICQEALQELQERIAAAETEQRQAADNVSRLQAQLAAKQAQVDLLHDDAAAESELPPGARLLLDPANPLHLDAAAVVGPLADQFSASSDLRLALEAALRAWFDAVVVRSDAAAMAIMKALFAQERPAAARLIVAQPGATAGPTLATPPGLTPFLDRLTVAPEFGAAAQRLLGHVFLAETLDAVPLPLPVGCAVVTCGGAIFHPDGSAEAWLPESQISSPLARRMLAHDAVVQVEALQAEMTAQRRRLEYTAASVAELKAAENEARRRRDDTRQNLAQKEGERQSAVREVERVGQRLASVTGEFAKVSAQTAGSGKQRQQLHDALHAEAAAREQGIERSAALAAALHDIESAQTELSDKLTDARLKHQALGQQAEHAAQQATALEARTVELQRLLDGRSAGVRSYDEGITRLRSENEELAGQLAGLQKTARQLRDSVEQGRVARAAKGQEMAAAETALTELRRTHEATRTTQSRAAVELAEARMHRQNHVDRIFNDYGLTQEQFVATPDPAWPNGVAPEIGDTETRIAQLQTEIAAMGPVNLVAVDEYRELEERYTFLRAQEDDLVKAKEKLLGLITMINNKTAEMFKNTFDQANANFEVMFTKLFNGGTARLVLLENAADPLEGGIDIIARPPGKRPQSITLLSGGERTMTAVSLLFAIYMIKPSPFALLDELDAALDDSNIGRFVQALRDFLAQSQFLIITHNPHTIASADIVYGVTQQEHGVSRIISMRLREIGAQQLEIGVPQPDPETPPPKTRRTRKAAAPEAEAESEADADAGGEQ